MKSMLIRAASKASGKGMSTEMIEEMAEKLTIVATRAWRYLSFVFLCPIFLLTDVLDSKLARKPSAKSSTARQELQTIYGGRGS